MSPRAPSDRELYENDPFYRYLGSTRARNDHASRKEQINARRRRRPRDADSRDKERARRYGLSLQDYRAILAGQDAACAICRRSDRPLCLDHCHATGKVRGFLCRACNLGLGYYNDDPSLTRAATAYLEAARDREEKAVGRSALPQHPPVLRSRLADMKGTQVMLPSQRALFDIPRDICYLNAASWSPLPIATQDAGRVGVARKGQPWSIDPALPSRQFERARRAAARLINADAEDVALISSVSYGVATAAKLVTVPARSRVLVLENDHSSAVLEWTTRADAGKFTVEMVPRPSDGDWTAAVLAAIEAPGAPPVGLASISSVHWADGGVIDIDRVAAALRKQGAMLLVDATHAAGVMTIDVRAFDPDFLVFPTYKWLLGPYGRAFLYIAKRRQEGVPLEQTSYGRRAINSERETYYRDVEFVMGALRFDMGERDHFISLEMASVGMEMMAEWGCEAIQQRLRMLTGQLADELRNEAVTLPDVSVRAPHIVSLQFRGGMPEHLVQQLAAERIYVAPRVGRMRISPHVYNDEADIERFVATFRRLARVN